MKAIDITKLMGGEIQVFRYDTRKGWYVRFWNKGKRRYVVRSLKTEDPTVAVDQAIQVWKELVPLIKAGVPTETLTMQAAVYKYLEHKRLRVEAGSIKAGALRDTKAQLKPFLIFCKLEAINKISEVQPHTFNDFMEWRRDKSLKITTGTEGTLKRSSLNKAIREVRAFWKYLRTKKLTEVDLDLMEVTSRHEEPKSVNVAFTPEHWEAIETYLINKAKQTEGKRRTLIPSQQYFRKLMQVLLQVLCDSGLRPQEAAFLLEWRDVKAIKVNGSAAVQAVSSACSLTVRNPKGKGSRVTVCDSGLYLKLWRTYVAKWRRENGHLKLKETDLVFGNPITGNAYSYSLLGNEFRSVLGQLDLKGLGYTIRSSRGFCVTRLLAAGHPPYLISKNLGHSEEVMRKNYEQLSEDDLIAQFINEVD